MASAALIARGESAGSVLVAPVNTIDLRPISRVCVHRNRNTSIKIVSKQNAEKKSEKEEARLNCYDAVLQYSPMREQCVCMCVCGVF